MTFSKNSKITKLIMASLVAFGATGMFGGAYSEAATPVPVVLGSADVLNSNAQNAEGWVNLDRWNDNQPDTVYYHIHGVPGDYDYSIRLSMNGTYIDFAIPEEFGDATNISLVRDGDNMYLNMPVFEDGRELQPVRMWCGKFTQYDRRQGGIQPRGYFVSANMLDDKDWRDANALVDVYEDDCEGDCESEGYGVDAFESYSIANREGASVAYHEGYSDSDGESMGVLEDSKTTNYSLKSKMDNAKVLDEMSGKVADQKSFEEGMSRINNILYHAKHDKA